MGIACDLWKKLCLGLSLMHLCVRWCCSAELQKSVPGQPSVNDVVQAVLKECRKENLKYKMVALSCMAAVLQATKEDRFQELADIIFPMIKKVMVQLGFSLFQNSQVANGHADEVQGMPDFYREAVRGEHSIQLDPC